MVDEIENFFWRYWYGSVLSDEIAKCEQKTCFNFIFITLRNVITKLLRNITEIEAPSSFTFFF